MQQSANSERFVEEAAAVAVSAEELAARLEQPFTGLNGLQDRARAIAVLHLRDAARSLQQFADSEWTAEDEARWQRGVEAVRRAEGDAEL